MWNERFHWFLIPAMLLLLLEVFLANLPLARNSAVAGVILLCLGSGSVMAQEPTPVPAPAAGEMSANSERLAAESFERGEYEKAVEQYRQLQSQRGNSPEILYNLGTSLAQAGNTTEGVSLLQEAYRPRDPSFNSATQYNAATALHSNARSQMEAKAEVTPGSAADELRSELEPLKAELDRAINLYRDALLTDPADDDIRRNLEIAMRDRHQLERMMNPDVTPTPTPSQSQDNETSDPQQSQPPPESDEEKEQESQPEQQQDNQDQSNEGKGQNQEDQTPSATPSPTPGNGNESPQPQPTPTPSPTPGSEGDPSDEPSEGTPTPGPDGQPSPTPAGGTPTPGPAASPSPGPQGQATPAPTGTPESEGEGSPAAAVETPGDGGMTEADVERLLNTLPEDDPNAIQRFFGRGAPNPNDEMERDW